MKNTIKNIVAALLALATIVAFSGTAFAGGLTDGPSTLYSVAYHSPGNATNITTGYTNALIYTRVADSTAAFEVTFSPSTSANMSNNCFLVVFAAMDSSTHATVGTRIALLPNATAGTASVTITNVTVISPWVAVQLENPIQNVGGLTNVTLRTYNKNP